MKKFEQLKRLYQSITQYADAYDFSDEMVSAVTADFDRLFELSWKTMKEYLHHDKMIREAKSGSPKDILKLAYTQGIIAEEKPWLEMLSDRNDDTHIYKHSAAILYMNRIITKYMDNIDAFIRDMSERIPAEEIPDYRIPEEFLAAWKESGTTMDDFVSQIKREKNLKTTDEVFSIWNKEQR